VLERQETVVIETDDPTADQAEVELMRQDGNRVLAMLPLVAKGQSIGLVELFAKEPVSFDAERLALARTMANEAAMALENARLYEDARNLADRDPLTGFYNHRYLHERLGEEVVRSARSRRPMSVLMLDLDDFKLVNDTFGHLFGDRVLTWTAELIRSTLRLSDVPARYGGDEFAIILPETDAEEARAVAGRIVAAFRDHHFSSEGRGAVPIGASIGAATFPDDGRSATELIAAADRALYRVKHGGGNDAAAAEVETAG
jgi:diguanylate cyclase (GGDEF)-like protein